MDAVGRWLMAWAARHTVPERREWVVAMAAELEVLDGALGRLLWALGALSLVSFGRKNPLSRSWLSWPNALRISAFGLALSAVLVVGIVWSNVIVPDHESDDEYAMWYIAFYVGLLFYFAAAGFFASRGRDSMLWGPVAGAVTGVLVAVVVLTTFIIVDNLFLDIVMTQPDKAAGFKASGLKDPRDYVNRGQLAAIQSVSVTLGAVGAGCGALGAALERLLRSHLPAARQT
jgi:hypothetical protein